MIVNKKIVRYLFLFFLPLVLFSSCEDTTSPYPAGSGDVIGQYTGVMTLQPEGGITENTDVAVIMDATMVLTPFPVHLLLEPIIDLDGELAKNLSDLYYKTTYSTTKQEDGLTEIDIPTNTADIVYMKDNLQHTVSITLSPKGKSYMSRIEKTVKLSLKVVEIKVDGKISDRFKPVDIEITAHK